MHWFATLANTEKKSDGNKFGEALKLMRCSNNVMEVCGSRTQTLVFSFQAPHVGQTRHRGHPSSSGQQWWGCLPRAGPWSSRALQSSAHAILTATPGDRCYRFRLPAEEIQPVTAGARMRTQVGCFRSVFAAMLKTILTHLGQTEDGRGTQWREKHYNEPI